jgi:hypothetical protein
VSRSVAAGTDNLAASISSIGGQWCMGGWFNFSSFTANTRMFSGDTAGTTAQYLRLNTTSGNFIEAQQNAATTNALSIASTTQITTGKWWFLVALFGDDLSAKVKLYMGDLATAVAEVTYGTQTAGVGAPTTGDHFHVGNNHAGNTGITAKVSRPFLIGGGMPSLGGSLLAGLTAIQWGWHRGLYSPTAGRCRGFWDLSNATVAQNPNVGPDGGAAGLFATGCTAAEEPPVPFLLAA